MKSRIVKLNSCGGKSFTRVYVQIGVYVCACVRAYYSTAASLNLLVSHSQMYLLEIELSKVTKFLKIPRKFSLNKGKAHLLECDLIERQQYEDIPCQLLGNSLWKRSR